jgi:hypothetical protein
VSIRGFISHLQFAGAKEPGRGAWLRPPRAPSRSQVDSKDDPDTAEGCIRQLDVHSGVGELARDLRHGPRAILDVDDDDVALIAHVQSGVLEGAARGRDVLDQDVDCHRSAAGRQAADPFDVDAGAARRLSQPGQLARPVVQNHAHVFCHRVPRLRVRCLPQAYRAR